MKNKEIIARAAVAAGILTRKDADEMVKRGEDIPFHTIQGWNLRGDYRVKEGEEGIEVKLWRKKEGEEKFYLAKSFLFSKDQLIKA